MAKMKVAINSFGRISRSPLRSWHGHKRSPLEVVAVNDLVGVENAAHLLKYDSTHGKFEADVDGVFKAEGNGHRFMKVDGKHISVLSEKDPSQLPRTELGVDLVIEGTGKFTDKIQAEKHITAPPRGEGIPTYVMGVNDGDYSHDNHHIISYGSGTTNCVAPLLKILDKDPRTELGVDLVIKVRALERFVIRLRWKS